MYTANILWQINSGFDCLKYLNWGASPIGRAHIWSSLFQFGIRELP